MSTALRISRPQIWSKLRLLCEMGAPVPCIAQFCQNAACHFAPPITPFVYAAILLSNTNRTESAGDLLNANVVKSYFAQSLGCYLRTLPQNDGLESIFENTFAYDSWNKTRFAKNCYKETVRLFSVFAIQADLRADQSICFIDLGSGNGELLFDIISLPSLKIDISKIRVLLVDNASEPLREAVRLCKDRFANSLDITAWNIDMRDLQERTLASFVGDCLPIVLASASMHHLQTGERRRLLSKLSTLGAPLMLFELEGNHERPTSGSIALYSSVCNFYGSLIEALVVTDRISKRQKEACVQKLLLAEAVQILKSTKRQRQNLHSSYKAWLSIANQSGFSVCGQFLGEVIPKHRPHLVALHFRPDAIVRRPKSRHGGSNLTETV